MVNNIDFDSIFLALFICRDTCLVLGRNWKKIRKWYDTKTHTHLHDTWEDWRCLPGRHCIKHASERERESTVLLIYFSLLPPISSSSSSSFFFCSLFKCLRANSNGKLYDKNISTYYGRQRMAFHLLFPIPFVYLLCVFRRIFGEKAFFFVSLSAQPLLMFFRVFAFLAFVSKSKFILDWERKV